MKTWCIEILLVVITMFLLFIGFVLIDQREIMEIRICKENPTLIIRQGSIFICDCEKLLKKYNIEVGGE